MLVVMEDIESPVAIVIVFESRIINIAPNKPALPTTHPRRKYIITPSIVKTSGVKTPPKVFNFLLELLLEVFLKNLLVSFIIFN